MSDDNIIPFPQPASSKPPPLLNLPPATKYLCLLLILIEAGLRLGLSPERQFWLFAHFGFVPAAYTGGALFSWPNALAPLTYALLHGSWEHVLINTVTLMAFGAGVERWLGSWRMLTLFALSSLAAIAVQFAVALHSTDPVVGASGGISGLFAATLLLMRARGAMPGRATLWLTAGIWIVVSALFGLLGGPGGEAIAWVAHIGGFIAGFGLTRLFMRPGGSRPVLR